MSEYIEVTLRRLEDKLDELLNRSVISSSVEVALTSEESTLIDSRPLPIVVEETISTDPYAGVDKDGVIWDIRIHSKAKEPKSVTTGKWKRKKGITDELYECVTVELKSSAPVVEDEEQPVVPLAPKAPKAPKAPVAQDEDFVKTRVSTLIKTLTDEHKVEPMDITSMIEEKSGVDTLAKATVDNLNVLEAEFAAWAQKIDTANITVNTMSAIAKQHGFDADLAAGVKGIFEQHDADCIGLVHYTDLAEVNTKLEDYLATWQAI